MRTSLNKYATCLTALLLLASSAAYSHCHINASNNGDSNDGSAGSGNGTTGCCATMGGINYCDRSTGRYICSNGYVSACYCSRHAVMDFQNIEGCCLWAGGVMVVAPTGVVVCRNGSVSEQCSLQIHQQEIAHFGKE
ncbi:MAG: hypothetical protein Q8R79_06345 [Legionellaceae bacterium]|nr:hypothetical protein [Legionellaceae bacterium]